MLIQYTTILLMKVTKTTKIYTSQARVSSTPDKKNVVNIPLDGGVEKEAYLEALRDACDKIKGFGAEALVIAFGADTFMDDPDTNKSGTFKLKLDDYTLMGKTIREKLGDIPVLVTQEGGYNLDAVPEIVTKFLTSLL